MFEIKEILWDLGWHILNFLILFFVLRALLIKPIKKFLDGRKERIANEYTDIENQIKEIEEKKDKYDKKIESVRGEARAILENANKTAEEIEADSHKKALEQTNLLLERGRKQIESERKLAFDSLNDETSRLAIEIAEKIMKKEISQEDNQEIIDNFIKGIE